MNPIVFLCLTSDWLGLLSSGFPITVSCVLLKTKKKDRLKFSILYTAFEKVSFLFFFSSSYSTLLMISHRE